jgi:hypothetical protein
MIEETPEDLARDLLRLGMLFAAESGDMRIVWRAYGDARNLVEHPLAVLTEQERAEFKCLLGC